MDTTAQKTAIIEATITKILWSNDTRIIAAATLHTVSSHAPLRPTQQTTVLGPMIDPTCGQRYRFYGQFSPNTRFGGHQFDFVGYHTVLPTTDHAIHHYLTETARWVGPSIAVRLVDAFGSETLEVIKTDPNRVANTTGLPFQKVEEMQQSLLDNVATEAAAIEVATLCAGALTTNQTTKAIRRWGSAAATRIRDNPFCLTKLRGVGFHTADTIYKRLNLDPNAPVRMAHALRHILDEQAQNKGHTAPDAAYIHNLTQNLVDGDWKSASRYASEHCGILMPDLSCRPSNSISLRHLLDAETTIALAVTNLIATDKPTANWRIQIDTAGLTPDQCVAVTLFQANGVMLLTGGPGTGKTYVTARIIAAAKQALGARLAAAAPTGKAAKQMTNALAALGVDFPATTIHSLLKPEYDDETGAFSFSAGPDAPLECDFIVIDEFSMVDVLLASSLFAAIKPTTLVLIVGDPDQLPPIGPGATLRDLLAARVLSHNLTTVQRNAGDIVHAAHQLKAGKVPTPYPALDLASGHNWRHFEVLRAPEILAAIEELATVKLPALGYDPLTEVQVISPTNTRGSLSCQTINAALKSRLNPGTSDPRLPFSSGDKVVRTANDAVPGYVGEPDSALISKINPKTAQIRIVNGDIGFIHAIERQYIIVHFTCPSRTVRLSRVDHSLLLAYCLTCHRMQGSESPVLVLPLHPSMSNMPMLTREWVYTAMTRPKAILVTIGSLDPLYSAIRRVAISKRRTTLADAIFRASHSPTEAIEV